MATVSAGVHGVQRLAVAVVLAVAMAVAVAVAVAVSSAAAAVAVAVHLLKQFHNIITTPDPTASLGVGAYADDLCVGALGLCGGRREE